MTRTNSCTNVWSVANGSVVRIHRLPAPGAGASSKISVGHAPSSSCPAPTGGTLSESPRRGAPTPSCSGTLSTGGTSRRHLASRLPGLAVVRKSASLRYLRHRESEAPASTRRLRRRDRPGTSRRQPRSVPPGVSRVASRRGRDVRSVQGTRIRLCTVSRHRPKVFARRRRPFGDAHQRNRDPGVRLRG